MPVECQGIQHAFNNRQSIPTVFNNLPEAFNRAPTAFQQ
jgi:hypothetical protein